MIELWKKAIVGVANAMHCSNEDAARWLMAQFRKEATKIEEQEKLGLPVDIFGSMSYDPLSDPSHPMHGWNPD